MKVEYKKNLLRIIEKIKLREENIQTDLYFTLDQLFHYIEYEEFENEYYNTKF